MRSIESLVTELQVQRLAWRERLNSLRAERDAAVMDRGKDAYFNQVYGAIESLGMVIAELDHILEDIEDESPELIECPGCGSRGTVHRDWCSDRGANQPTDSSERERLGWWCIQGVDLLYALRRCSRGADADTEYTELYANCRIEKP